MSLHDKIMNLSVPSGIEDMETQRRLDYKAGHRDARHAAAELANEAETAAYASGRSDEREEWGPVLEALMKLCTYFPTDSDMLDLDWDKDYIDAACEAYDNGLAAIKAVTGEQA